MIHFRKSTMTNFSISSASAFVSYSKSSRSIIGTRIVSIPADENTTHNNNNIIVLCHDEAHNTPAAATPILNTTNNNESIKESYFLPNIPILDDVDKSIEKFHFLPKIPILDDCTTRTKLKLNNKNGKSNYNLGHFPIKPKPSLSCCYRPTRTSKRQKLVFHSLCDDENELLTQIEPEVTTILVHRQELHTHVLDENYDEKDETDAPASFINTADRSVTPSCISSSKSYPPSLDFISDDWFLSQLHSNGLVFLPPRFSNISIQH